MSNLNTEQLLAVNHNKGPMLVLAGPGSGKTKVLTERVKTLIEAYDVSAREILVITFSKKAAVEMQERFFRLTRDMYYPVTFGTFHSVFFHILKQHNYYQPDCIATKEDKLKFIIQSALSMRSNDYPSESWAEEQLQLISRYKNCGEDFSNTDIVLEEDRLEAFFELYSRYQNRLKSLGKIDFDDMVMSCHRLLSKSEAIRNNWNNVYRYILVDEFQDSNPLQYEILKMLSFRERNIWCCGDDDQSIYKFRGATPNVMQQFLDDYSECEKISLLRNYRSFTGVLEIADKLIKNNKERIDKPCQIASGTDAKSGEVRCIRLKDAAEEADFILEDIVNRYDFGTIAVLYRTEGVANYLEERFISCGVNFDRKESVKLFYEDEYVKDILAYLRLSQNEQISVIDEKLKIDLLRILNKPERQLTRECLIGDCLNLDTVFDYFKNDEASKIELYHLLDGIRRISDFPPFAALNYILKGLKYEVYLKRSFLEKGKTLIDIQEFINELVKRCREFRTIRGMLDYIEELRRIRAEISTGDRFEKADDSKKVVVMQTIHSSKGLEYDTVYVVGLSDGIIPHKKAVTESDIEEERRLLYVAITRAKKNIILCARGEKNNGKQISGFVRELGINVEEPNDSDRILKRME